MAFSITIGIVVFAWFEIAFLPRFRKYRTIRRYFRIRRILAKRYGASKYYTPQQIEKTLESLNIPSEYIHYAQAIYSDEATFSEYYTQIGDGYNYQELREEISDTFHVSDLSTLENSISLSDGDSGESGFSDHGSNDDHG